MKKLLILICLISPACFGCTNLVDFATLAAGWGTTTDIDDLQDMADVWLDGCRPDPNALDVAASIKLNTLTRIDLDGENYDQFIISTMPGSGTLYDIYGTYSSGYGIKFTDVRRTPYTVKHGGGAIWYYAETGTSDSFTYAAKNIIDGRQSNPATVTITKTAYTKDNLFFERSDTVTIPDADAIEFDDSFSFCMWFRPKARAGVLLEKRAGGAGLKISIRAKHLVIEAWNAAGDYGKHIFYDAVTMDEWQFLSVTAGHATENTPGLPTPPFSNAADCVIAGRSIAQIDKLTWFPAKDSLSLAAFKIQLRTAYSSLMAPTDYAAQFRCDEGTGTTITDFVSGTLTGTITGAEWQPDGRPLREKPLN